jgi:hypothetical protein
MAAGQGGIRNCGEMSRAPEVRAEPTCRQVIMGGNLSAASGANHQPALMMVQAASLCWQ